MVMTVLEAHVAPERWDDLRTAIRRGLGELPPQMVEMFFVQSTADPTLWRGISVWKSREALDEMRRSVATPGGVLIFRAAGAEPVLTVYSVVESARP